MVLPFNINVEPGAVLLPTAPPLDSVVGDNLNNNLIEDNLHANFIVNNNNPNKDIIRIEKRAILETSVELTKIINSNRDDGPVTINDVDYQDFYIVARFMETKQIDFHGHLHTLQIIDISVRYIIPDLTIKCVKYLDLNLTEQNVLDIFHSLWFYNTIKLPKYDIEITNNNHLSCSKNIKQKLNNKLKQMQPITSDEYISALLNNCLQYIDMQANDVLNKDEILELRFEELEMIVKRDTLQIDNEVILFNLLARWSRSECIKKKIELTSDNRRRVLGALCYTPRYLIMPANDFKLACVRVDLLDPSETKLVNDCFNNMNYINNKKLTPEQICMLNNFKKTRPEYALLPIYLSERSNPLNYSKKMRKFTEKYLNVNYNRDDDDNSSDESCCSKMVLNCLSVFTCIFD